jgi:hypothetical protein
MLKASLLLPAAVNLGASNLNNETDRDLVPSILRQYWQVVLRWKWLIAGIIVAAPTLGLVATLLAIPRHTATSRTGGGCERPRGQISAGVHALCLRLCFLAILINLKQRQAGYGYGADRAGSSS